MRNQPHIPGDTLRNVRAILREIEDCAANADYLYRGEPEHYNESPFFGKISSNLYRQYAGYDTAIKLAPDFALAYYNRGNAYLVKNEMDKAIADFRKAIELDESLELPEDIAALLAPQ